MSTSQSVRPIKATRKTAPKNCLAEISPARKAAFHILLAVGRGQSHSDDLLRGKAVNALSAADRNLATALVLGVLRWQILLDKQILALLKRPNAKLETEVMIALRLGAFQIVHMDRIPARAAIDESVELAKKAGHRFASGMVNAVLRKLVNAPARKAEEMEAHPSWMVERWTAFYGLEATHAICRHGQSQPALTVRLTEPELEAELIAAGITLEGGELLTAARTVVSGDVTATAAFREGRVRLQDEGSQLVAEILSNALNHEVTSVIDACAAPGGKTLILAERHRQARILALESSAHRLEQLRKRLAPIGDRVECRLADATALTEVAGYDLALADVPCSGTGTLGRNPEIRHRLRPEEIMRQAERQHAILTAALGVLRSGGKAVYSTCSLEVEENEQVVSAVLANTQGARLLSISTCIEELLKKNILTPGGAEYLLGCLTHEGYLRLLPGRFHTDGFFIAMVERTEIRPHVNQ